ncbi:hypothetical protein AB837_00319 [bacterium AB1]|nr:hypothetical protein AB837_00319 [bacterium AB1]
MIISNFVENKLNLNKKEYFILCKKSIKLLKDYYKLVDCIPDNLLFFLKIRDNYYIFNFLSSNSNFRISFKTECLLYKIKKDNFIYTLDFIFFKKTISSFEKYDYIIFELLENDKNIYSIHCVKNEIIYNYSNLYINKIDTFSSFYNKCDFNKTKYLQNCIQLKLSKPFIFEVGAIKKIQNKNYWYEYLILNFEKCRLSGIHSVLNLFFNKKNMILSNVQYSQILVVIKENIVYFYYCCACFVIKLDMFYIDSNLFNNEFILIIPPKIMETLRNYNYIPNFYIGLLDNNYVINIILNNVIITIPLKVNHNNKILKILPIKNDVSVTMNYRIFSNLLNDIFIDNNDKISTEFYLNTENSDINIKLMYLDKNDMNNQKKVCTKDHIRIKSNSSIVLILHYEVISILSGMFLLLSSIFSEDMITMWLMPQIKNNKLSYINIKEVNMMIYFTAICQKY